jgi:hypothetical protein
VKTQPDSTLDRLALAARPARPWLRITASPWWTRVLLAAGAHLPDQGGADQGGGHRMVNAALILEKVALVTIVDLVVEVILKFRQIVEWFQEHRTRPHGGVLTEADRERVGFTLQNVMDNGDYQTIQGVFNQGTRQMENDARVITSLYIDDELAALHGVRQLVIYD